MATKYTTTSVSGYDDTPTGITDDGSQTPGNRVDWADIPDNLTDPLKTAVESINTKLVNSLPGTTSVTSAYAVAVTDYSDLLACDGTFTLTLPAAATAAAGFFVNVANVGSGVITVDGNGAETVDGSATLVLNDGERAVLWCDGTGWYTAVKTVGEFAADTRMIFFQASAPTGWTQIDENDVGGLSATNGNMLRVVTGTGGGTGGSDSPITFDAAHTHGVSGNVVSGGAHTHSISADGEHTHSTGGGLGGFNTGTGSSIADAGSHSHGGDTGSSGGHAHSFSVTSASSGPTFSPSYADVIIAEKD